MKKIITIALLISTVTLSAKVNPLSVNMAYNEAKSKCLKGDAEGCFFLGMEYEYGGIVKENLAIAEKCYARSCKGGYREGCESLDEAREALAELREKIKAKEAKKNTRQKIVKL